MDIKIFSKPVLVCDLRGKKKDEEAFVIVRNNATEEKIIREQILHAIYDNRVDISQLSRGTQYAAHVHVQNAKFEELTADGEILLFKIPGML